MAKVFVTAPGKGAKSKLATIDDSELDAAVAQGWTPISDDEAKRMRAVADASPIVAGAEALARGATVGLSDVALTELGRDPEKLAAGRERLGDAGTLLEVTGAVAPMILSGGAGAVGTAARAAPSARLAASGTRVAKGVEGVLGGGRAAKLTGAGAGAAYETAAYGAGAMLTERALGGPEITGERLLQGVGTSAGIGMLLGVAGRGVAMGAPAAARGLEAAAGKARELGTDVAGLAASAVLGPKAGFAVRALGRAGKAADDLPTLQTSARYARGAATETEILAAREGRKAAKYEELLAGAEGDAGAIAEAQENALFHRAREQKYLAKQAQHVEDIRAREADIVRLTDRQVFKTKVRSIAADVAESLATAGRRALPVTVARAAHRQEDLLAVRDRVNEMAANPLKLADGLRDDDLFSVAPEATRERTVAASRAIAFLKSVEPPTYRPPFSGGVELVDSFALDDYEQRVQAIVDPVGVLRHGIKHGTLTVNQVQAVAAVYPKQLAKLRSDVLQKLGAAEKAGQAVEYATRVRLGVLLGMPLDRSLLPEVYAQLQQSITSPGATANQPPPPSKNPGRPAKSGDDGRTATQSQRREGGAI